MSSTNPVVGRHLIADFSGARYQTDAEKIEYALRSASSHAGATVLEVVLHTFADSGGITGVAVLAESHISVHSWPEHDYIAFDIFMCGQSEPQQALQWLKDYFKPHTVNTRLIERSVPV